MEWFLYLLIGILVGCVHSKILDYKFIDARWIWESVLIAIFWPVVLIIDAMIIFI